MAGLDPAQAAAEAQKTIADLGLTENFELGAIGEREQDLQFNVGQAEAGRAEQEPRAYRTQQNAAVAHGLASTGMASLAHTNLVNRFAAQRTANQARLTQGLGGFKREREGVKLKKTLGETGAYSRETEQESQYAAEHPPAAPVAPKPGSPVPGMPPGYVYGTNPGEYVSGKVRVGGPVRKSYTPGGR